jgi:RNA polymerase sigma factor (sigma-70 family)
MEQSAGVCLNFEAICRKAIGTLQRRGVCNWIDRNELISEGYLALAAKNPQSEALAVTIARAAMIDAIRRNAVRERGRVEVRGSRPEDGEEMSDGDQWDATVHGRDHLQLVHVTPDLWEALKTLPARQYQALALAIFGGLTGAEVAAELGISGTAARTLIEKAKKNLRKGVVISDSHTITKLGGETSGILPHTEVTL